MSINRRMDKEEVVHKHHGILAIKTKELMALALLLQQHGWI